MVDYIRTAQEHGAKITRVFNDRFIGSWIVLDQPQNSYLYQHRFLTEKGAAKAYCEHHNLLPRKDKLNA